MNNQLKEHAINAINAVLRCYQTLDNTTIKEAVHWVLTNDKYARLNKKELLEEVVERYKHSPRNNSKKILI